ncbi:hypothetical protein C5167_049281, partial [Papaver somniferum]
YLSCICREFLLLDHVPAVTGHTAKQYLDMAENQQLLKYVEEEIQRRNDAHNGMVDDAIQLRNGAYTKMDLII